MTTADDVRGILGPSAAQLAAKAVDDIQKANAEGWVTVQIDSMFGITHLFACPICAATVAPTEEHRRFHLAWHSRDDEDQEGDEPIEIGPDDRVFICGEETDHSEWEA